MLVDLTSDAICYRNALNTDTLFAMVMVYPPVVLANQSKLSTVSAFTCCKYCLQKLQQHTDCVVPDVDVAPLSPARQNLSRAAYQTFLYSRLFMSVSIESCSHASSGVVNWVHTICKKHSHKLYFLAICESFLPLYSAIILLPELF